jgi:hypothetical protein
MKIGKYICLLLTSALMAISHAHAAKFEKPCTGKNETLECLKENFAEVYEGQYFKFLIILDKAQVAALDCTSPEKTAAYLDIASKIGRNQEVEDGFKDFLETKFVRDKPACLLDGLLLADERVQEIILGKYLANPRYISRKEVDGVLAGYKEHEKYKEMLKRYGGKK